MSRLLIAALVFALLLAACGNRSLIYKSEHPDIAFQILTLASAPDLVAQYSVDSTHLAVRRAAAQEPVYQNDAFPQAVSYLLDYTTFGPHHEQEGEYKTKLYEAISAVETGSMTPNTALTWLESELQAPLGSELEIDTTPCFAIYLPLVAKNWSPPPPPTPTNTPTPTLTPTPTNTTTSTPTNTPTQTPTPTPAVLSILLGYDNVEEGLFLDYGGDVDTEVVSVGSPPTEARRTGNGQALPSPDGNQTPDYYMQFRADDSAIFAGDPTTRIRIEVEYFDQGTDTFNIQYDALSSGPLGDGRFKDTCSVIKTDTGRFQTAVFRLCDAYFANRDNGADFRICDWGDGAEIIRRVTVTLLPPGSAVINVDSCGANPWDTNPDSEAIQACVDRACNGDTVTFTSGVDSPGYQGYLVDKTIFLVATTAKSDLTFTSTNPANHALLQATADLKGFVVRLFARSRVPNPGAIDNITISHLNLHGGRDVRRCFGADGIDDGLDDNWGSWLPECSQAGDPWCSPGSLAMAGAMNWEDAAQDYLGNPWRWSTGLIVDDLIISNTECGTALHLDGAAGTIQNSAIQTAGDHVHASGCTPTESDEGLGDWSDGITFTGPGHLITGNIIRDASDVGIVFFGGKDTIISNNAVRASTGNYGMFAGIAVHPWIFGDVSGVQVVGNQVINEGDSNCGGIHAGINIGTHMWGGGCVGFAHSSTVGNPNLCTAEPPQPFGTLCTLNELCQVWAHVAAGATFTLKNNYVSGAQVNYLIEGLDLVGTLVESGNASGPPRMTDWEGDADCWMGGEFDTWGAIDRVAHHPTLDGWVDQRIHCER
jgi:hypothetical protein